MSHVGGVIQLKMCMLQYSRSIIEIYCVRCSQKCTCYLAAISIVINKMTY